MCNFKALCIISKITLEKFLPISGYPDFGATRNIVLQRIQVVEKNENHLLN